MSNFGFDNTRECTLIGLNAKLPEHNATSVCASWRSSMTCSDDATKSSINTVSV